MSISGTEGDLRVRRTRAHLRRALAELLTHSSFREITVTQVCQAAMVHRTTFYKHYADKDALFDDLLGDRINQLFHVSGLPVGGPVSPPGQPVERLAGLLERMRADRTLVSLLADSDLSPASTQRLTRELVQQLQARAPRASSQTAALHADLLAHLHAAVLTTAMAWWAQGNDRLGVQQLARTVWRTLKLAELTDSLEEVPGREPDKVDPGQPARRAR